MRAIYAPRFGPARVVTDSSGLYQPHPDGKTAVTLGVVDRTGEIADIVAWMPDDPSHWWVRTGAVPVLGEAEIERAGFLGLPLFLFGRPSDWLFNHGAGGYHPASCLLDWSIDPRIVFNGVRIVCHGEAVARQLEQAQRRHDRPLNIQVAWSEAERAA